ncbi:ABC transporter permease [Lacibacterium aquatile]|uniref:ABC transporter permease n=1 Tax=Lacibacterium aquatile TaxID=1168082 RepID=A0ABW5DRL9_9PROT
MRTGILTCLAALVLLALTLAALLAPWFSPGDPLAMVARPLLPPFEDWARPLGTDRLGRDVLAALIHGARVSLSVALAAALAATLVGSIVGTLAGYVGGWVDILLMRLADAFRTVPNFVLALALVSVFGPSLSSFVIAIGLSSWTGPARLVRAEVLSLKSRDFVDACRVLGMPGWRIALVEVLPNAVAPAIALGAVTVASAILIETALSFLGLGDPNSASWGQMIAEGRAVMRSNWTLSAIPGVAVVAAALSVNILADALSERLAPRRAVGAGS